MTACAAFEEQRQNLARNPVGITEMRHPSDDAQLVDVVVAVDVGAGFEERENGVAMSGCCCEVQA